MKNPAFDDNGQPVPKIEFDYGFDDVEPETLDREELPDSDSIIGLLKFMDKHKTPPKLLLFFLYKSDCESQRELARKLRLSEGRVSQMLKALRYRLAASRLKL